MMDPNGKLKGDASDGKRGKHSHSTETGANLPTCLLTLHLFCMRAETRNSIVNIAEFDPFSLLSDKSGTQSNFSYNFHKSNADSWN